MKLALVAGGKASCLVCGWEHSPKKGDLEKALLAHLRATHDKRLISKEDKKRNSGVVITEYSGVGSLGFRN